MNILKEKSEYRGFWKGIEVELLIKGNTLNNCLISPNGKIIAYTIGTEHGSKIFIADLETKEDFQLTDGYSLSTGTPYGGGVLTWRSDSNSILFTTKNGIFDISVAGGLPKHILDQEKSFSPHSLNNKIIFSVEHKNSMSIMIMEVTDNTQSWPIRLPINESFLYDAVLHPTDNSIAIHAWSFPNMSWNGSKIVLLTPKNNNEYETKTVAGSETVATAQPKFSHDGKYLAFLNEQTGWRNLWISEANGDNAKVLVEREEEHAYSTWVTGESNYAWLPDNKHIVFTRNNKGIMNLAMVNIDSRVVKDLDYLPKGEYTKLSSPKTGINILACQFTNYKTRTQILIVDLESQKIIHKIQSGLQFSIENQSKLIKPEIISFPTSDGQLAHGFMYLDKSENKTNNNPPCIFLVHGGPTGMHLDRFHYNCQYFASRGWAVFSVNHRGSIGYGKAYREILNGQWGNYDVEDTLDAYNFLKKEEVIDPDKCAIMGGSAGGFTTLMFLVRHPGIMKAGINFFGVSDLFLLDEETHYLESRYTELLVGPLPKDSSKYFNQSAVFQAEKIKDPLLILQGEIDKVVPKNQSELIKDKIEKQGGIVEMKIYADEGHGFKKFDSIKDSLTRTEKFLKMHVLYDR